jgi:iron(III) transport system ATP-binding protein
MDEIRPAAARPQTDDARGPRVSVRGLTKRFRTKAGEHVALDNVSIDILAGEFLVLLGPSGCGKTTLLRSIAGLEEPDGGDILLEGQIVSSASRNVWLPPEDRNLGMVFQSYALWPHMNVFENVAYPLRNERLKEAEIRPRVSQTLDRVGLGALAASYPGQLSGGQQQRVALSRALVSTNGLVLFDEPLSNLDAKVRARLRLELVALQQAIGFSSLYVTHDQSEALALADRIAVMEVGRIAQIGSPEEIYETPATRYVADFIGSANEVQGTVGRLAGDECLVETSLGTLVGRAGAGVDSVGQRVAVMFRPEQCSIAPTGAAVAEDMNRMTGLLERSLFQGATFEHVLRAGSHLVVATVIGGERFVHGAELAVAFPRRKTMIFPLPGAAS